MATRMFQQTAWGPRQRLKKSLDEVISDKIPSLLAYFDKVPLHVTRPVRWDSDRVVLLEDIAKEIVRNDALDRVLIGFD